MDGRTDRSVQRTAACQAGLPDCLLSFGFETTVTFTTAGVTRAARVSIARSSVSNAATLLSSSAAAAGAATALR